ncbi:MAG: LUD domain-containing protein, partial [Desulfobacterales bacterium]|nr:LUD domain-containing protein [Desulfobacterales bacterium]
MADGFRQNVERALADEQLRRNFAFAMGNFILKRKAVFNDPAETERLRLSGEAIKRRALARLPELLEQLEASCTRNGIRVHWAETTAVANRIVLGIIESHAATCAAKGKSMVSEEMHLNAFLASHGIEVVETDLGESELNAIARRTLRRKFQEAGIGLSGVNFAVAETGTLCLVENEGNGRMCTTVPPVHIALMGIEKVVERLEDLPPLLRLLTGSATGQLVTTYVNLITSPR